MAPLPDEGWKDVPAEAQGKITELADGTAVAAMRCYVGRTDVSHTYRLKNGRWHYDQKCESGGCWMFKTAQRSMKRTDGALGAARYAVLGSYDKNTSEQWREAGVDPQVAWEWMASGLPAGIAQRWASQFTIDEYHVWSKVIPSPDLVALWRSDGEDPAVARQWIIQGEQRPADRDKMKAVGLLTPESVAEFRATAGGNTRPRHWIEAGFTAEQAAEWTERDDRVLVRHAANWRYDGYTPDDRARWRAVITGEVDDVAKWVKVGVSVPDEAARYVEWAMPKVPRARDAQNQRAAACNLALSWLRSGHRGLDEINRWYDVGVDSPFTANAWAKHGYDPDRIAALSVSGHRAETVRCGGEEHTVEVTWANRRGSWRANDHDLSVESAAVAFGADRCECAYVVETAKSKRAKFVSHGEALAWVANTTDGTAPWDAAQRATSAGRPLYDIAQAAPASGS